MPVIIKENNTNKNITRQYVNVNGAWKQAKNVFTNVNGTWKPAYNYNWEYSNWNDCTVGCGGGTQTRTAVCKRSDNLTFTNNFCNDIALDILSRACNTQPCFYTVELTCKDVVTNQLISNALVEVFNIDGVTSYGTYVTNALGVCSIDLPAYANYLIKISCNGYENYEQITALTANTSIFLSPDSAGDGKSLDFTINTALDTSKPNSFTLNLISRKTRKAETIIDWGDGTTTIVPIETTTTDKTAELKALCTHVYSSAGVYNVTATCSDLFPLFIFSDYNQLITVNSVFPQLDVEHFRSGFRGCTGLTTIPRGLFDKNTLVTSFDNCFYGCTGLTTIPQGLFDKNTKVTDFSYCFSGCAGLTTTPQGLFDKNTLVTNFRNCFTRCAGLTTIPQGLFDKNTLVTDFRNCFYYCTGLTTIPQGLFDKNTLVTNFGYCFFTCTSLTTIPQGLFDNNTLVTNFDSCFLICTRLTTIPQGLFDNNTQVTNFSNCFRGCRGLTTIPQGLFDKNTQVTSFSDCFSGWGLTTIPQGLFDNNTLVTSFDSCFSVCAGLTTTPQGLFDKNTKVTNFGYCFSNCASLTTIPQGLFDKNTLVTDFRNCFYRCVKLQLNPFIFSLSQDKTNRFAGKSMNFDNCFAITSFTGIQGTAPDLWNYTYGSVDSTATFRRQTPSSLTNFNSIPTEWK